MISLALTYPPSANRLWRNVKGRMVKSKAYREWLARNAGYYQNTITGPYKLTLQCSPPDKRRRDLGNLEKAVSDLLQDIGVVSDDCNMQELSVSWKRDLAPGVYVWVQTLMPKVGE